MALMYDMKVTVAYVPNGKVIGLSKIARIADMVSKRLQLQDALVRTLQRLCRKSPVPMM